MLDAAVLLSKLPAQAATPTAYADQTMSMKSTRSRATQTPICRPADGPFGSSTRFPSTAVPSADGSFP